MAENLRQQVQQTADLLLRAVDRLEAVNGSEGSRGSRNSLGLGTSLSSRVAAPVTTSGSRVVAPVTTLSSRAVTPVERELKSLFSWKYNDLTTTRKRKGSGKGSYQSSKKKKLQTWTHTFVCLSNCNQRYLPDSQERAELKLTGLGEKQVSVFAFAEAQELHDALIFEFPKLAKEGGYELLRVPDVGGRELDVLIPPEDGYSVEYLKAVVASAKLYIRPLQKDLDTTATQPDVSFRWKLEWFCVTFDMLSCNIFSHWY